MSTRRAPSWPRPPGAELFLYQGDQHLFSDSTLPSYDEAAAALLRERVLAFLAELPA